MADVHPAELRRHNDCSRPPHTQEVDLARHPVRPEQLPSPPASTSGRLSRRGLMRSSIAFVVCGLVVVHLSRRRSQPGDGCARCHVHHAQHDRPEQRLRRDDRQAQIRVQVSGGWSQAKRYYTARERTSVICNRYDNPPVHDVLAGINASFIDTEHAAHARRRPDRRRETPTPPPSTRATRFIR